jgi:Uma2 family endonuclease
MKITRNNRSSLATRSRAGKIAPMRQRDMQHHTYADYLVWSAPSGNELIDGVAYVREPPSPSRLHQEIVVELSHQITTSLRGKPGRVYVAPLDVRLPKDGGADDQIDTVVQPDIFITRSLQKLDDRGMCGVPDWVAEVLSPPTARYDRTTKLAAYERAGVPEVWLIDPTDRTVAIYRLAAGHYTPPVVLELKGRTAITAVPGVSIDWDCLPAT